MASLTTISHTFGKKAAHPEFARNSEPQGPQKPCSSCPQCGSDRSFKNGSRYSKEGRKVQRFLCRSCGFRFSSEVRKKVKVTRKVSSLKPGSDLREPRIGEANLSANKVLNNGSFSFGEDIGTHDITKAGKGLYALSSCSSKHRVCDILQESKNLDTTTETKTVVGDRKLDQATAKGLLLQYTLYLQKEGYGADSRYISCIRMLINCGSDVYDPENVKEVIARQKWKDGTKMQTTYAYDALTKMLKLTWTMPRYRQEEAYPFIPDEKEIDALILGAGSKRMSVYLQTLKETMADPSEALRIMWIDINGNVITLNKPVKGHYPRPIQVSNTLIAMLNSLPRTTEKVFPTSYQNMAVSYYRMRKKIAYKLNNPRIMKISLITFRHFGATMVYHQTRNILLVKKLLGHKRIDNTMKYTQLIQFKDNEYEVATASTLEEAKQVLTAGFDYVTEKNGIMIFRKPKRYVNVCT
jgi:integrase